MSGLLSLCLVASVLIPAGNPAPPLEGQTLDGRIWTDSLKGQVTIVEFFATWCPHCRRSLAGYHRLAAAREVRLIIVDVDEEMELVSDFFSRNPPPRNAGVVVDQSGRARQNWGVTGFPCVYVIDKDGIIRESFSGWDDRTPRELAELIDSLRKGPEPRSAPVVGKRAVRSRRGKPPPPRERAMSPDEHARQLGVEVIR